MTLTLSPQSVDQYRKSKQMPLSLRSKYCKGCKSPRSAGQWDEGAEVWRTCVRRGVK